MKRYKQLKELRLDPFKAWYFPDQDNSIKFPLQHDHLEFVKSLTDAYEKGYVRIYVSPTEIICESNELPSNSLYIKVLKILQKEVRNLNDIKYITWNAVKGKSKKFKITEAIDLSKLSKEELEDLKAEIRSQPFLDPKDMRLVKEIDSILIGFDVSGMKFGKFKKSRRVTPFNRNRT